jgi:NitT/TauT family transport system substrate-binding protein
MYAGNGRNFVAVCQLNDRFPMTLVTREPVSDFTWSWLEGKTVLAPGQGGTAPAEFTRGLMREAGVDPAKTRFAHDLSTAMLRELFEHGLADAFIVDLGTATQLVAAGHGHISYQHALSGGRMPNSVYYVLRERLEELAPRLVPFVASIDQAMAALCSGTAGDLTQIFEKEWPDEDARLTRAVTDQLAANGTWATVKIDPAACERWTGILHRAGLTREHVRYDEIVDNTAIEAAGVGHAHV